MITKQENRESIYNILNTIRGFQSVEKYSVEVAGEQVTVGIMLKIDKETSAMIFFYEKVKNE